MGSEMCIRDSTESNHLVQAFNPPQWNDPCQMNIFDNVRRTAMPTLLPSGIFVNTLALVSDYLSLVMKSALVGECWILASLLNIGINALISKAYLFSCLQQFLLYAYSVLCVEILCYDGC